MTNTALRTRIRNPFRRLLIHSVLQFVSDLQDFLMVADELFTRLLILGKNI